jgi:hypothetical protein
LITGVIEAKEERDVMTCNIPNAFIQAYLPKKEPGEDRVVMKITGVLVNMLVNINPELYGAAVVMENQKKVIYVEVLKAIYGMLEAALLWYKTFRKDLEDNGFIFNLYNPCVANNKVQGLQQTIVFHVDNLKSSHKSKLVNNKFEKWLNSMYGKHGRVTATRGGVHNYLRMELDYRKQGELKINMTKYVKNMLNNFPVIPSETREERRSKNASRRQPIQSRNWSQTRHKKSGDIPHLCCKRTIPLQKGKAQHPTSNLGAVHKSKRPEPSGLGKAHESYEIPKWHQGREPYPACRRPESGQMACGRIICGTSRL